MTTQQRHESPDLGDAIVRMLRGLTTRAASGDTEALEQLARIERLAPVATSVGMWQAHTFGHSYTELATALGVSRQGARQRVAGANRALDPRDEAHQLVPGHDKRTCPDC